MTQHLVIVRTSGSILDLTTYNCQELGLAQSLENRGVNVSLILAGNESKHVQIGKISVYYCKLVALNQQIAYFKNICALLRQLKPSLIQIHEIGLFMSWFIARWARKNHVPSVLIQGNYRTTQKPIKKQFEQLFNAIFGKSVLKTVSAIGYKTHKANQYVQSYIKKKSFPTYIGLDNSKFKGESTHNWQKELKLDEKKVLLYVGALEKRRNPSLLIETLSKLSSDVVLILVGLGTLQNESIELAQKLGVANRCFFLGALKQTELPSLYHCADLFLLASDYEIYGMVILEAMYFGVPVVSTLTAGSESIINHGNDGIIINSLDSNQWAEQVENLLQHPDCLNSMRIAASKKINEELLWDKAVDGFIELYKFADPSI